MDFAKFMLSFNLTLEILILRNSKYNQADVNIKTDALNFDQFIYCMLNVAV